MRLLNWLRVSVFVNVVVCLRMCLFTCVLFVCLKRVVIMCVRVCVYFVICLISLLDVRFVVRWFV